MPQITSEHLSLYESLFCVGNMQAFGTWDAESGRCYVRKEPVTHEIVMGHLLGKAPLGVFMLKDSRTRLAVVDFDNSDTRAPSAYLELSRRLGIPAYEETSRRKGYHAWTLCEQDVPARKIRAVLRHMLTEIGLPNVEVFPKQDSLPDGGLGNFVVCPLFGRLVDRGRTVFVDDRFVPHPDQWAFLRGVQRVAENDLDTVLARFTDRLPAAHQAAVPPRAPYATTNTAVNTRGLLPCARRMLDAGVTQNQRVACFRLALALRRAGLPQDSAIQVLAVWARKNRPQDGRQIITPREIESQTTCAYGKPYASVGCEDPAIQPFCLPDNCPVAMRSRLPPTPTKGRP